MSKQPATINVEHAFNPELRQAQGDMDAYLASMPYMDEKGKIHSPETGKFMSADQAGLYYSNPDKQEEVESFDDFYKSMENFSFSALASLSAEFKDRNRTYSEDIDYIIRNKIDNMGLSTELVEKDGTPREKSEADVMYDRVMKLRDSIVKKNKDREELNTEVIDLTTDGDESEATVEEPKVDNNGLALPDVSTRASLEYILKNDMHYNPVLESKLDQAKGAKLNYKQELKAGLIASEVQENNGHDEVIDLTTDGDEDEPFVFDIDSRDDQDDVLILTSDGDEANNSGAGKNPADKWGTPGRGDLAGTPIDFATRPKSKETEEKKKTSLRKKIAVGAVALAALVGAGFLANKLSGGDDSNSNSEDGTEEIAGSSAGTSKPSGVDFSNAIESFEQPETEEATTSTTETPVEETEVTQEDLDRLEASIAERTAVVSDAQAPEGKPDVPYSRATSLYGDQATNRIIQAVDALKAEGVDAQWHGNPATDRTAWISIDGNSETSYVWNRLAQEMAKQDIANYLEQTVEEASK